MEANRAQRREKHKEVNSLFWAFKKAPKVEISCPEKCPRFPDVSLNKNEKGVRYYWNTGNYINNDPRPRMERLAAMGGSLHTTPTSLRGAPPPKPKKKRKEAEKDFDQSMMSSTQGSQFLRHPLRSVDTLQSTGYGSRMGYVSSLDFPGPGEYSIYSQFPAPRKLAPIVRDSVPSSWD